MNASGRAKRTAEATCPPSLTSPVSAHREASDVRQRRRHPGGDVRRDPVRAPARSRTSTPKASRASELRHVDAVRGVGLDDARLQVVVGEDEVAAQVALRQRLRAPRPRPRTGGTRSSIAAASRSTAPDWPVASSRRCASLSISALRRASCRPAGAGAAADRRRRRPTARAIALGRRSTPGRRRSRRTPP